MLSVSCTTYWPKALAASAARLACGSETVIWSRTVPRVVTGPVPVEMLAVLTWPLSSSSGMCARVETYLSAALELTSTWIASGLAL